MKDQPIIITQSFNVSVEKVWAAITTKEQMVQWFFNAIISFDATEGFETSFNIHNIGKDYLHVWKVLEVIPLHKIVYSWKYADYAGDSYVVWELTTNQDITTLTLTHNGQNSFPQDNPDFSRENCIAGWQMFINQRLKTYLGKV